MRYKYRIIKGCINPEAFYVQFKPAGILSYFNNWSQCGHYYNMEDAMSYINNKKKYKKSIIVLWEGTI